MPLPNKLNFNLFCRSQTSRESFFYSECNRMKNLQSIVVFLVFRQFFKFILQMFKLPSQITVSGAFQL